MEKNEENKFCLKIKKAENIDWECEPGAESADVKFVKFAEIKRVKSRNKKFVPNNINKTIFTTRQDILKYFINN